MCLCNKCLKHYYYKTFKDLFKFTQHTPVPRVKMLVKNSIVLCRLVLDTLDIFSPLPLKTF